MVADLVSTRSRPRNTTVYSSNSGVWPDSVQPAGLSMRAMLTASVAELTRPTYSAMRFGRLPAAAMIVGFSIRSGMDFLNIAHSSYPVHDSTGRRGYFVKRGSMAESEQR